MVENRRSYHHGDLRRALLEAGLEAARGGGAHGISLRELTRAIGVSSNAAYRHFSDREAFMRALASAAQGRLALAIHSAVAAVPSSLPPDSASIERLRRVGLSYIAFAREEPGWFELAYASKLLGPSTDPVTPGGSVTEGFAMLRAALDGMVAAGVLPPDRRPGKEWACWSAVHGFADIAVHGPLRVHPASTVDRLAEEVVETTIAGVLGRTLESA